ncbi:MAG: YegS/Rv2252/BmrU family lipid kinase [Firmicutes bacterium]|nr:YegS/Rv2252/BmrU family lipid kinase [Bacillota bacterium]
MILERYLLIYNKASGSDSIDSLLTEIVPIYQEHGIILTPFCLNIGSKEDFLPLLKHKEFTGVLISGGDGSIRSVLSFLLDNDIDLPVGILPAGTCNDLANSLGLPKNIKEAALVPLKGKKLAIDVGVINDDTYFFSSCAGGYFMPATYDTPVSAKKNIKQFAYYFKAATKFTSIKPFELSIVIDGTLHKFSAIMFAIGTGSQIAGFNNILNEAELTDGKLDLFIIDDCSYYELPNIVFNIFRGQFANQKHVRFFQGESFYIDGPLNLPIVFDGEKGERLPLSVEVSKKRITLFV